MFSDQYSDLAQNVQVMRNVESCGGTSGRHDTTSIKLVGRHGNSFRLKMPWTRVAISPVVCTDRSGIVATTETVRTVPNMIATTTGFLTSTASTVIWDRAS